MCGVGKLFVTITLVILSSVFLFTPVGFVSGNQRIHTLKQLRHVTVGTHTLLVKPVLLN